MAKLTVKLTDDMDDMLEVLADARGLPKTQVVRDAVRLMKYLDDAGHTSDLMLRSRNDGTERQLVLESQIRPTSAAVGRPARADAPNGPRGVGASDVPFAPDVDDATRTASARVEAAI